MPKRKLRGRTVSVVRFQRGKTTIKRDRPRRALKPGKRRSRTGNTYWETRTNRSDLFGGI